MSIEVNEVSKYYGKQAALDAVSFSAKPGEILGFLGPNGAGKSTMMKIITGFIPPSKGNVHVNGIDVKEDPIATKQQIGYLAEQNPLYLNMYVKEYLSFMAGIHKIKSTKARVSELIQLVGLEKEQHKKIAALSKGYKQRVGLAHALLHDPKVLILDEPTTGLDPNQLAEIRALIRSLGKEKIVMLSTHIMQEVEAICDRVIIIHEGKIVANHPTKKLGELFQKKTKILVEFENEMPEKLIASIKGITQMDQTAKNSYSLQCNADQDIRNQLFQLAVDQKNSVLTLQKEEMALEHIFKELTQESTEK